MTLPELLVGMLVAASFGAFLRSALEWVFYKDQYGGLLTTASGLLLIFWSSILAFLASR